MIVCMLVVGLEIIVRWKNDEIGGKDNEIEFGEEYGYMDDRSQMT